MKRAWRIAAGLALVLAALATGLILARKPVAELALTAYLDSRGVAPVALTVRTLDDGGATLERILIGVPEGPHLAVERLSIDLDGLTVASVSLQGVRVVAAMDAAGGLPDAGPVMALMPQDAAADASPLSLPDDTPEVHVRGVILSLRRGDAGDLDLRFDGELALVAGHLSADGPVSVTGPGGEGQGHLELGLSPDLTGGGQLSANDVRVGPPWLSEVLQLPTMELSLARQPGSLALDLTTAVAGGEVSAHLIAVGGVPKEPDVSPDSPVVGLEIRLDLPDLAPLLPLLDPFTGDLPIRGGAARIDLGVSADLATLPTSGAQLAEVLRGAVAEASLTGTANFPESDHDIGVLIGDAGVRVDLIGDLRNENFKFNFNVLEVNLEKLPEMNFPSEVASKLGSGISAHAVSGLRLSGRTTDLTALTASGEAEIRSGALAMRVSTDRLALSASEVDAEGLTLTATGLTLDRQPLEPLRFAGRAAYAAYSEVLTVAGTLRAGAETLGMDRVEASGAVADLDLDLVARTANDLDLELDGSIRVDQIGSISDDFSMPDLVLRLDGIKTTVRPGKAMRLTGKAQLAMGSLSLAALAEPATLAPVGFSLDLAGSDIPDLTGTLKIVGADLHVPGMLSIGRIEIEASRQDAESDMSAPFQLFDIRSEMVGYPGLPAAHLEGLIRGWLPPGQPEVLVLHGILTAGPVVLQFVMATSPSNGTGSGGLHLRRLPLADLSDLLRGGVLPEGMELTDGHVNGDMNFSLGKGLSGNLAVSVRNGGVTVPEVALSDINTSLRLESLVPPATRGVQQVRIGRLSGPFEMTDLELRFATLQEGEATVARVEHLAGSVFGGELAILPFTLRPEEERRFIQVALNRIDMVEIVDLAGLEDFILTGSLSGTLPVEIVGENGVVVRQGKLLADGPGTLQLDGNVLRGILGQQGGEEIDLMIRTLEDFRYDVLEVSLDKPLEGETTMLVTLGGLNPAVLDGHPFRFNISVTGDADRLLATILTVYRASSGVIEQGIKSLQ